MTKRSMHFITLMCAGPTNHNNGGWRHPDGDGHMVLEPSRYEEIARISEEGLFDGIFLHRRELADRWDLSIFCRVDPVTSCARMAVRDGAPSTDL